MGAQLHYLLLDYEEQLNGAIIEIGSDQGEKSTDFYAGFVYKKQQFNFYTVDIDKTVSDRAKKLAEKVPNMESYCTSGEKFLKKVFPTFNEKICYAYLDNFDWNSHEGTPRDEWPDWMIQIEDEYKARGVELTQQNSAAAHLRQAMLIEPFAADKCLIQFDDTYGEIDNLGGKGMTAVPYLRNKGWNILVCDSNTVLLSNF
jgi:hypothetical protein